MIRADIIDPHTGLVVSSCTGADHEGYCPSMAADGSIPCAGMVLQAEAPEVGWSLRIPVPEGAHKCPVRCFSVASS